MRVRLSENEEHDAPTCDEHGFRLQLEDWDSAYGQGLWLCPVEGCRVAKYTGPSDNEIYLREQR